MVESEAATGNDEGGLFPQSVGERLHAARLKAGLDLNDVATRTRVPMRHLEAIERNDYAALPSATYAIGFVRSFARAIGSDEAAMARDLRAELGRAPPDEADYAPYEPADPARVPSRLLAWTAAAIAAVLLIGYLVWRSDLLGGSGAPEPTVAAEAPAVATPRPAAAPATPSATGQVVLTATAPVWLRIYDKADKVLLEKEMAPGETYSVPPDADTPMIRTGRADALKVTIDGTEVAPLGPPEQTVRDVEISAKALVARGTPATTAAPPVASPQAAARHRQISVAPQALPGVLSPSPPVAAPATSGNTVGQ